MKHRYKLTAAIVAVMILAGCGAVPAPAPAPTETTLLIGTTAQIESASRADYNYDVLSGTLTQLAPVRVGETGYAPLLTDYDTADAQTWRLAVRDGMCWEDGQPVTAGDIKFTLDYLDKQEPGKYLSNYQSVRVVDDRVVELVLKNPNINALGDLTTLRILPAHLYREIPTLAEATEQQSVLGCGPYRFERFDKDAGVLEFRANRSFGDGKQTFERVIFKLYGNADTMLMALKKGEIDMVYSYASGIDPAAAADLAAWTEHPITLEAVRDTSNPAVLAFNNSAAPWDAVNLRLAVSHALDYDKFRELFGSQYSAPSTAGFVPAGTVGYIDTPVNTRDLTAARELLAEAGAVDQNGDGIVELAGSPLTLELLMRTDKPVYQRYGELVQTNLLEAGIAVKLKPVDVAQFRTITEQERTHQAALTKYTAYGMGMNGGMGSGYMDSRMSAGQCQIDSPDFAAIADRLRSAITTEEYAAATADCQNWYAENLPAIALYWDSYLQAYSADLSGFVTDGTFGLLNTQTWFSVKQNQN